MTGETPFTPRRVLIIEDDDDSRDILGILVGLLGHVAVPAATPSEALRQAGETSPDVALVDIGLPEMDGCDLARKLRDASAAPLRLVALTGYSDPAVRQTARAAGFDDYVVKPLQRDQLEALLRF